MTDDILNPEPAHVNEGLDHDLLNEHARVLYSTAFSRGWRRGMEEGRNESSLHHSLDKLKYVGMLGRLAQEMDSPPANETQRTLINIIRNILGGVSHFNAQAEIHAARDACGATGFQANFTKLIENAEAAEAKLRQHS